MHTLWTSLRLLGCGHTLMQYVVCGTVAQHIGQWASGVNFGNTDAML